MSDSIQLTPSASSGSTQSKLPATESGTNTAENDDVTGFTAVFASYSDTEPASTEQQMDEHLVDLMKQLLPKEAMLDGNTLPQADDAVMWQALLLMQPDENVISNNPVNALQTTDLLDSQRKPLMNASMMKPDFFTYLSLQSKEPGTSIPAGLAANNITAQLAATHFAPGSNESLLVNFNEQLSPLQGANTSLPQSFAAVGLGSATQAAATQTQMAPLNLGQNAWESNLGSRLQMMIGQNVQSAEIRLDPPELGALDIKIKVSNDVASVNITSPHTQVREALESAVPRLREMFAESGLSLGDVNVRQESFTQQENSTDEQAGFANNNSENNLEDAPVTVTRNIVSDSLLDIYA